ncbi:3-oxoacyl-ACP synthase III [Bremerella sp. T1]|uniref:3-oxoacyl-ACP synthase III n=1 Tax=Bremerella sp. TYQ1 TaxID=3119568 RepID=UPI001CC9666F|nr:3-oxoacyl-ACP synthase III [Bremerella volcania]UBM36658.1 3-oxoacyl-ACP synthase III [Bremerella volcania]
MKYQNVCIEGLGYCLPDEIVTSAEIEQRLAPLYERLRLPEGRLELMTGISQRRFFPDVVQPGDVSIHSARNAMAATGLDPADVGALIHGSVCRDFLEPATACRVHHALGLPQDCVVYDVSNACLGILNGAIQIANMIELGQIKAGIVVGTESGRHLVDNTIETLNNSENLSRNDIKLAVASLTIGSASCAMVLCHKELSRTGNQLVAASARAHTQHHDLCHSIAGKNETGVGNPLMQTDSEKLMAEGIATGAATFADFLGETGWSTDQIQRTICHQVGLTHRKLVLEKLQLPIDNDFATVQWLGNTGAAALPTTLALATQTQFIEAGQNVALLGIGSGINCVMIGAEWNTTLVGGTGDMPEGMERSGALSAN